MLRTCDFLRPNYQFTSERPEGSFFFNAALFLQVDDSKPRKLFYSATKQNYASTKKSDSEYEQGNFLGLSTTGAILVALVALICAIILVLLGFTAYLCGRKGMFAQHGGSNGPGYGVACSAGQNGSMHRYTIVDTPQTVDPNGSIYNYSNRSLPEEKPNYHIISSVSSAQPQLYRVLELQSSVNKNLSRQGRDKADMRATSQIDEFSEVS
ncbi:hypothetical protein Ciccas_003076 [Cichlidogyrus casuarinus]|uniref:Uncharacterized protein n=1 Tax=Cichlidogyrus casuarinus TaxID=1844966 RepID=A0ABD2QFV3_9PLAT